MSKFLCRHIFSFILGIYHIYCVVALCLTFEEPLDCFSKQLCDFTSPTPCSGWGSSFSTSLPTLYLSLDYNILVGMGWHLIVVLVCISLMTNDTDHFFHVFIDHLYFFFVEMSIQIFFYPF